MRTRTLVGVVVVLSSAAVHLSASGPLGIYGIVERVVFEPGEASPERIQLWGAFSYVEGIMPDAVMVVSRAQRGYLYFRLPDVRSDAQSATIRREWLDLKAVAGTGQAVGFGRWPGGARENPPAPILGADLRGMEAAFRVRPADEKPGSPAIYMTNAGIVKLSDQGSHDWVVKQLRDALKR